MSVMGKTLRDLQVSDNPKDFEMWLSAFENYLTVVEIGSTLISEQIFHVHLFGIFWEVIYVISGLTYDTTKDAYNHLLKALKDNFILKSNLIFYNLMLIIKVK